MMGPIADTWETGTARHPGREALTSAERIVTKPPADIPADDLGGHARTVRLWSSDLEAIAAADRIGTLIAEGILT